MYRYTYVDMLDFETAILIATPTVTKPAHGLGVRRVLKLAENGQTRGQNQVLFKGVSSTECHAGPIEGPCVCDMTWWRVPFLWAPQLTPKCAEAPLFYLADPEIEDAIAQWFVSRFGSDPGHREPLGARRAETTTCFIKL